MNIDSMILDYLCKHWFIYRSDIHYFGYDENFKSYKMIYYMNFSDKLKQTSIDITPEFNKILRKVKIEQLKNAK